MKKYLYSEIRSFIDSIDTEDDCSFVSTEPTVESHALFLESLSNYFNDINEQKKSVLGIDIFKYSKYDYEKQKMIPIIFRYLIIATIDHCFQLESNFSLHYDKTLIIQEMIDTGDGGFLVFENSVDAIIFLTYFAANLHSFNSYHTYPNMRKYIGPLTIRYAITYDKIYQIDSNFYGPAIINNARIMSRDKLNRLLIDGNTYDWFLLNTNGIENLLVLNSENLFLQKPLVGLTLDKIKTLVFSKVKGFPVIKNVFCQKLEKINVKDDTFDVYNLIIQICLTMSDDKHSGKKTIFVTTIGNMNCNGI